MSQDIKPTRSEELRLKQRIELAESGHSVLEKKRDNLIHEFMELIPKLKETQQELSQAFQQANNKIKLAMAFDGIDRIKSISELAKELDADISSDNIMGTAVPEVEIEIKDLEINNPLSLSTRIIEARQAYEQLITRIEKAAEIETAILNLVEEIESTKRRVNALEHKVIPELKDALDYISQRLEEDQRENTFRIKRFKEKES